MIRIVHQRQVRQRSRQGSGQTAVVVAVAAFLALGLFAGGKYVTMRQRAPAVAVAPSDDEIYTGSILHMPDDGKICRQTLFDNRTGRLSDNGNVDCQLAAFGSVSPNARMEGISKGFRDH